MGNECSNCFSTKLEEWNVDFGDCGRTRSRGVLEKGERNIVRILKHILLQENITKLNPKVFTK